MNFGNIAKNIERQHIKQNRICKKNETKDLRNKIKECEHIFRDHIIDTIKIDLYDFKKSKDIAYIIRPIYIQKSLFPMYFAISETDNKKEYKLIDHSEDIISKAIKNILCDLNLISNSVFYIDFPGFKDIVIEVSTPSNTIRYNIEYKIRRFISKLF